MCEIDKEKWLLRCFLLSIRAGFGLRRLFAPRFLFTISPPFPLSGFQAGADPHDFLVRRPETFKLPGARPYFAEPAAVMSVFQFVPDPSSSALPLQVRRPRRDTSRSGRFSGRTGGSHPCGRVRGFEMRKGKTEPASLKNGAGSGILCSISGEEA